MLKSPPLVATLSDSMRMSPCSWGDIFTWPLRGDRIIGLRHFLFVPLSVGHKRAHTRDEVDPHGSCRRCLEEETRRLKGQAQLIIRELREASSKLSTRSRNQSPRRRNRRVQSARG